jgi:hypothetical protein
MIKRKSELEDVIALLEKILRVVSLQVGEGKSITERARLLKLAGIDNRTIAEVLGTTDATVRTITANYKSEIIKDRRKNARRSK